MNDNQRDELPDLDYGSHSETPRKGGGLFRIIFLLLIVLGAFYLFRFFWGSSDDLNIENILNTPATDTQELQDSTGDEKTTSSDEEISKILEEPFDPEKAIQLTQDRAPSELITLQNQLDLLGQNVEDKLQQFEQKFQAMELRVGEEQKSAVASDPRVDDLLKEFSELRDEISAMKSLVGLVENLRSRVGALEGTKRKVAKNKTKQVAEETMPFRLVSIDLWNGEAYAGLMHKGNVALYRQNETLMGWQIEAINYNQETVVFRLKSGKRVTKQVER